jgi:fructokinase
MRVVCAGELLVDRWPGGAERPGGAPANAAFHAAMAGAETSLVSRVGRDPAGRHLLSWLESAGVDVHGCQIDPARPTGHVEVDPAAPGGPGYAIPGPVAWDFIAMAPESLVAARVLVLGTLAQRHPCSRAAIRQLTREARRRGVTVLVDLNLRPPFFDGESVLWTIRHGDVLKLNRVELQTASALLGASGPTEELFEGLLREFGVARGVLTCGADGVLVREDGTMTRHPCVAVTAVETTGCGDALGGVLAAGLAHGQTLRDVLPAAVEVAAFVATQRGATPRWPESLRKRVRGVAGPA